MDAIMKLLDGKKTFLAAAGLLGLAVFQVSQGQYDTAVGTFLAALGAAGLRHAIAKGPTIPPVSPPQVP